VNPRILGVDEERGDPRDFFPRRGKEGSKRKGEVRSGQGEGEGSGEIKSGGVEDRWGIWFLTC
jgi:hypothetical protein